MKPIPLIFLPAWGSKGLNYSNFLDNLSNTFDIHVLNLPIYSNYEIEKFDLSNGHFDFFTNYFSNEIKKLRLDKYIVVGHSFGAAITINMLKSDKNIVKAFAVDPAIVPGNTLFFNIIRDKYIPKIIKKTLLKSLHKIKSDESYNKLVEIYSETSSNIKYLRLTPEEEEKLVIIAGTNPRNVHPYKEVEEFSLKNKQAKVITHSGTTDSLLNKGDFFAEIIKESL